ncbi:hypothetical protein GWK47_046904 [Chionoecetes opilio]|uniref:Uncharacterized protein n=1 Tax=Chionoecetes opilio TaxID=41210 RepID=A0A8J4Y559_CHIOP|nr:hypothetical protein GWK47_046904 [Chionoecetes opilio]
MEQDDHRLAFKKDLEACSRGRPIVGTPNHPPTPCSHQNTSTRGPTPPQEKVIRERGTLSSLTFPGGSSEKSMRDKNSARRRCGPVPTPPPQPTPGKNKHSAIKMGRNPGACGQEGAFPKGPGAWIKVHPDKTPPQLRQREVVSQRATSPAPKRSFAAPQLRTVVLSRGTEDVQAALKGGPQEGAPTPTRARGKEKTARPRQLFFV